MRTTHILPFLLFFISTQNIVYAENEEVQNVEDKQIEENEEEELEPLKELPTLQTICPNLDGAFCLSADKDKNQKIKIEESFLKNVNLGIETISLCKDLWFLTSQRVSKNKDYNFDYHTKLELFFKKNIYLGADYGYSIAKGCVCEDEQKNSKSFLDTKYAHLSEGFYTNLFIGYNHSYNIFNDVSFGLKLGYANANIETLKDQTCTEGKKTQIEPLWIGAFVNVETKGILPPHFVTGTEFQINYLINKQDIDKLDSYLIPSYGHSGYKINFGLNLYLMYNLSFEERIIVP